MAVLVVIVTVVLVAFAFMRRGFELGALDLRALVLGQFLVALLFASGVARAYIGSGAMAVVLAGHYRKRRGAKKKQGGADGT